MRAILFSVISLLIVGTHARADATASTLYNLCIKNDAFCPGYLAGIASVMGMMGNAFEDKDLDQNATAPLGIFAICSHGAPGNAHVLRNIFIAWVEVDPKRKAQGIAEGAMNALRAAWPCQRDSN